MSSGQVEVISFQSHHLFGVYRNNLESINTLTTIKKVSDHQLPMNEMEMDSNNYNDDTDVLNEMEMEMLTNTLNPIMINHGGGGGGGGGDDMSDMDTQKQQSLLIDLTNHHDRERMVVDVASSPDITPTSSATPSPQKLDLFAKEHHLVKLVEATMQERRNYDYLVSDVQEMATAKSPWLTPDYIYEGPLETTLQTLKKNLLFEMALLDKKSGKLSDVTLRFLNVYLNNNDDLERGLANQEHTKKMDNLVIEAFNVSRDLNNDIVYKEALEPKQRGRTSDENRKKVVTAINALRRDYIKSGREDDEDSLLKKPGVNLNEHVTHKYSVFDFGLQLTHDNIPKQDNFAGVCLQDIFRVLELTTNEEFPMRQLMLSIMNAEALIGIELLMDVRTEGLPCYCSRSGDRIVDGDDVHQIRLLEYNAERQTKWKMSKSPRPFREFEHKLFTDSVSVYWIKRYAHIPTSLFPVDFSKAYKDKYSDQFASFFQEERVPVPVQQQPIPSTTNKKEKKPRTKKSDVVAKKPSKQRVKKETTSKRKPTMVKKEELSKQFQDEEEEEGSGMEVERAPPIVKIQMTARGKVWRVMDEYRINAFALLSKKEFSQECDRVAQIMISIGDSNFKECMHEMIQPYVDDRAKGETPTTVNRLLTLIIDMVDLFYAEGDESLDSMQYIAVQYLIGLVETRRANKPDYANRFKMIENEAEGQIHILAEFTQSCNLFLSIFHFLFPTALSTLVSK